MTVPVLPLVTIPGGAVANAPYISYIATGGAVNYDFDFRIDSATWIAVTVDGTVLNNADVGGPFYSVTFNVATQDIEPGGTVNLLYTPPDGVLFEIQRRTPIDQQLLLAPYVPYTAGDLMRSLDKLAIYCQDNLIPGIVGPQGPPGPAGPPSSASFDLTSAEIAAGITPVNYSYEPGNVLRYGVNTAPGSTDMTVAFQTACHPGVGQVVVPYSSYVSGRVPVPSNTKIVGLGFPVVKQRANEEQIFDLSDSFNVEVTGVFFDGDGKGSVLSTYGNCAVMSEDTVDGVIKNCSVHHCRFTGFYSWAVVFAGNAGSPTGYSYNVRVHDNLIENQVDEGVAFYYMRQFDAVGNTIRSHAKEGIKATTCDNFTIDGNRVYALATGGTDGPLINVGTDCSDFSVINNRTFKGNKGIGIEKRVSGIRVIGNSCEGTLQEGIGITSTGGDASPMSRMVVTGNVTKDTGLHGINIAGLAALEAYSVTVTGNNIYNCGTASTAAGISVFHFIDAVVEGNTIHTGSKEGVIVSSGTAATVGNNRVNNVSQHGIRVAAVVDSTVSHNIVYDANRAATAYDGINVENTCTNAMVSHNVCKALSGTIGNGVENLATNPHVMYNVVSGNSGNATQFATGAVAGIGLLTQLAITDGGGAPVTLAGQAIIYVDVADGDLKIKFGDGFVRTIGADS